MAGVSRMVQANAAMVSSLPAPVGGWNARDSIANMSALDAVQLQNMFPSVSNVVLRGGFVEWATGLPGQVESLLAYSGAATSEFYAVADSEIYDVTSGGTVGAAVVTGLSNSRWEYANISTSGGDFILAVNGVDDALIYDGATWSNPSITGVSSDDLNNIVLFKNRLWFLENDTLRAWYLPTSSIGGVAEQFDLSSVARLGGTITALGTWTVDAGYGMDDNLVFITSKGEVIIYRGTDPSSASTWSLIGVYTLGSPIGKRCLLKYRGDILVLTLSGLQPLAQTIQSDRAEQKIALSDKIQGAFSAAATQYQTSFGWQIVFVAENDAIMVNVPIAVGQQQQFVMNDITKAWCNFTGWEANCWEIFNNSPYFGGDGVVCRAWDTGYADNDTDIESTTLQAFNYYDSRGVKKYFTRARPSIFTDGTPSIGVGMNVDFDIGDTSAALSFSPTTVGLWDAGIWDTSNWGSGPAITNNWQGITGIGYCGGLRLKSASQGVQIEWAATDVVYQRGWAGI